MPEWNIMNDIASAQKLFAAGVPLYVMPLDSTLTFLAITAQCSP
jgi:inosine-uridine nucleoside N-ribohydrolase